MFVEELVTLLVAGGAGTALGTDIFAGSKAKLPEGDGPFLTITETGGIENDRTQNEISPPAWQRPSAQIVARAKNYVDARTLARAAYNSLNGVRNATVSGTLYQMIDAVQEPFDLGLDTKERARIAFNVRAKKNPS